MKIIKQMAVLILVALCAGCGSSGVNAPTQAPVAIEYLGGTTGLATDSIYEFTFAKSVDTGTVNTSTFLLNEGAECNPSAAVAATITCASSTVCTLYPENPLSDGTVYTVCLTTDIMYEDGTNFEGTSATFTTAGQLPYTVTPSTGSSYLTIDPSTAQAVAANGTVQFTVTADEGYAVDSVAGTCPLGTWAESIYTTGTITEDCTVEFTANAIKVIFITAASFNGNLGGVAGADALCMADANKPAGSATYKAMIADGVNRAACTSDNCVNGGATEHVDWVLAVNTPYFRPDRTTRIGSTMSDIGIFPLVTESGGRLINSFSDQSYDIWTGLTQSWVSGLGNCQNWRSSGNAGPTGSCGNTTSLNIAAIFVAEKECITANNSYIACVEQ